MMDEISLICSYVSQQEMMKLSIDYTVLFTEDFFVTKLIELIVWVKWALHSIMADKGLQLTVSGHIPHSQSSSGAAATVL